jgi:pimeloyl-ACP methyl ester carboxylesterase
MQDCALPQLQPKEYFCDLSQMSYLAHGQNGPAVVLLHGWSAFKELWWSTLLALGKGYQAFAPDMPGHGSSRLEGARMHEVASRIELFCAAMNLDSITLVGHSMGGNVSVELALSRPDLVRRLVLVSAATNGQAMPAYTRSYLIDAYGWAALRVSQLLGRGASLAARHVRHDHAGGVIRPALRRAAYAATHDAAAMHRLLNSLSKSSVDERLAQIDMPVLVVSGRYDPLVPVALSRRVASVIPGAQYAEIPDAAHNPMDERPRAFNPILLRFLASTAERQGDENLPNVSY